MREPYSDWPSPAEQLREANLQDLGYLPGGVHRDVDPAFEQDHWSA